MFKRYTPAGSLDVRGRQDAPTKGRPKISARAASARTTPVILIGPSGLFEQGLQQVLKAHDFNTLGRSATLEATDPVLIAQARIVIIMDASDETGLPRTVAAFRARDPALRIVLLVDTTNPLHIAAALRIPAHAFLCQKIGCEPLMKALDIVLGDGAVLSIKMMSYLLGHLAEKNEPGIPEKPAISGSAAASCRSFSDREVDVLRCLTDGASNKLIARRFQIAESTVKIHVKGILRKINVQNRTQAAIWALAQTPAFGKAPSETNEAIPCDAAPDLAALHV